MASSAFVRPNLLWRSRLPSTYTLRLTFFAQEAFGLARYPRDSPPSPSLFHSLCHVGFALTNLDVSGLNPHWSHGFGRFGRRASCHTANKPLTGKGEIGASAETVQAMWYGMWRPLSTDAPAKTYIIPANKVCCVFSVGIVL